MFLASHKGLAVEGCCTLSPEKQVGRKENGGQIISGAATAGQELMSSFEQVGAGAGERTPVQALCSADFSVARTATEQTNGTSPDATHSPRAN